MAIQSSSETLSEMTSDMASEKGYLYQLLPLSTVFRGDGMSQNGKSQNVFSQNRKESEGKVMADCLGLLQITSVVAILEPQV